MDKSRARSLKLKAIKYCICNHQLLWKDPGGILLTCIIKEEVKEVVSEFRKGVCGGHHGWRDTTYKILRGGYY